MAPLNIIHFFRCSVHSGPCRTKRFAETDGRFRRPEPSREVVCVLSFRTHKCGSKGCGAGVAGSMAISTMSTRPQAGSARRFIGTPGPGPVRSLLPARTCSSRPAQYPRAMNPGFRFRTGWPQRRLGPQSLPMRRTFWIGSCKRKSANGSASTLRLSDQASKVAGRSQPWRREGQSGAPTPAIMR